MSYLDRVFCSDLDQELPRCRPSRLLQRKHILQDAVNNMVENVSIFNSGDRGLFERVNSNRLEETFECRFDLLLDACNYRLRGLTENLENRFQNH
jgi:hypothetical protein